MFEILGIKKEERKEFLAALVGGIGIMGCVYAFAPSYYGW